MTENPSTSISFPLPVLGFAARSGTGKTTLLRQLIPLLKQRGHRIGVIKHSHHKFDIDHPGKDSFELRKAGAEQMLIASNVRMALMTEYPQVEEKSLAELIDCLDTRVLDFVLVEGFREQPFPKIELYRGELGNPLLSEADENIIAIAADHPDQVNTRLPLLDISQTAAIVAFIEAWIETQKGQPRNS